MANTWNSIYVYPHYSEMVDVKSIGSCGGSGMQKFSVEVMGGACDHEVCGVFMPGVQSPQVENQLQGHLLSS